MSAREALQRLQSMSRLLPAESVLVAEAEARVLARPFFAPFAMPAFSRAAMDGYAIRGEDVAGATSERPRTLRIVGDVPAGAVSGAPLEPGTAYRIATGGAMPEGADTMLRQEDVAVSAGGELVTERSVPVGKDVVEKGVYAHEGERMLPAGRSLGANDIALMTGFGATHVDVIAKPRVAYVETGDELASPGEPLPPGHIYGSNNVMLALRAEAHGADVVAQLRMRDESETMAAAFDELLEEVDVVVSTGGVSVGPKDFVPDVLRSVGCDILFDGLPIRPGHPMMAARRGDKLWIGLAGNPTAALVTHEYFVRPVLWRMAGLMFTKGFNPFLRAPVDGMPVERRPRTSLYLGRLQSVGGRETVDIDVGRRPTALPAPFAFNAVVGVDPPSAHGEQGGAGAVAADRNDGKAARVRVYPAEKDSADTRLVPSPWDVGGILLAGGASRRMGHSKLFLPVDGVPLIVRAYRALAAVSADVKVIGAPEDAVALLQQWEGQDVGDKCFPDEDAGEGPLAGLLTGLRRTSQPVAFCLAADLPFVDGEALRALVDAARWHVDAFTEGLEPPERGFVLSEDEKLQPLAALYPVRRALAKGEGLWDEGGRAMHEFIRRLGVEAVPSTRSLANVNDPEDYRAVRHAVGRAHPSPVATDASSSIRTSPIRCSVPLLAFSGHSGSGKTTLISRLVPLLKARGLRVVVIKHGRHFELDKPGKDSWLFKEAGADGVLLFSDEELAYMVRPETSPGFQALVDTAEGDADVILVEGFKSQPISKVVVLRDDEEWAEHPLYDDAHVQAVYGDGGTQRSGAGSSADATEPGRKIPFFARSTPRDGDDEALPWLLDWISRRLT